MVARKSGPALIHTLDRAELDAAEQEFKERCSRYFAGLAASSCELRVTHRSSNADAVGALKTPELIQLGVDLPWSVSPSFVGALDPVVCFGDADAPAFDNAWSVAK